MGAATRLLSRPLPRQLVLLAFLVAAILLFLGLAYRTFVHVDVAVAPGGGLSATAGLMQQLDSLDVDYRLRKDGTILVDNTDAALLVQAGVPVAETRQEPHRLTTALLLFSMLVSGIAAVYVGLGVFRQLAGMRRVREAPAEATPEHTEATAVRGTLPRAAANPEARLAAKLFEAEHPQTVAIYLLGLAPEAAAAALEAMPVPQRERVWKRMTSSGECDARLRRRVAELFATKMKRLRRQQRPAEATAKMVSIFRQLSPETRRELLAMLRREDAGDEIIALLEA